MDADPAPSRAFILDRGRSVSEATCDDGDVSRRRAPQSGPLIGIGRVVLEESTKRELKLDPDPSGFERTDITEQSISVARGVSRSTDFLDTSPCNRENLL